MHCLVLVFQTAAYRHIVGTILVMKQAASGSTMFASIAGLGCGVKLQDRHTVSRLLVGQCPLHACTDACIHALVAGLCTLPVGLQLCS